MDDKKFEQEEREELKLTVIYGPADDSGPSYHHIKIPTYWLNSGAIMNAAWGWDPALMDQADIIVVQRQISNESLDFIREMKKRGKTIIYTIGDNLFQLPPHSPVFHFYTPQVVKQATRIMAECHAVTTTTQYLADEIKKNSGNPHVYTVPHLIDIDHIKDITPDKPDDEIRIGWTTTPYHIGDWPICSHAIKDICKKYPQVKVVFWGFLNDDMADFIPKEQLEYYGFVSVRYYYKALCAMDLHIGIAPLEFTPYNNSKSPLKFVEYGMLGIPGVYSPTPPYKTVGHMDTGLKPKKNRYKEWYKWLEYLIENPDERERIGNNAREYVKDNHYGRVKIQDYYQIYKQVYDRVNNGWQDIKINPAKG